MSNNPPRAQWVAERALRAKPLAVSGGRLEHGYLSSCERPGLKVSSTSGPIDELRHLDLRRYTASRSAGCVYVTAFLNVAKFAQYSKQIDWETEVWIADNPEHMIHFNVDKFLGPYAQGGSPE